MGMLQRTLSDVEKLAWLRLARTGGVGPTTFFRLMRRFRSAERAVAELLSMIADEDPEVRALAVRSLASLGAVEHLPEMVR